MIVSEEHMQGVEAAENDGLPGGGEAQMPGAGRETDLDGGEMGADRSKIQEQ